MPGSKIQTRKKFLQWRLRPKSPSATCLTPPKKAPALSLVIFHPCQGYTRVSVLSSSCRSTCQPLYRPASLRCEVFALKATSHACCKEARRIPQLFSSFRTYPQLVGHDPASRLAYLLGTCSRRLVCQCVRILRYVRYTPKILQAAGRAGTGDNLCLE
ncbi:hypothetical protein N656DRAFT_175664 [Canariomyces notabilis]|uniref:Uncharacterized protein n=1 Tax=Canariomyces notabilis TaxID=2074819 RepID=A0AAN6TBC2_9PEZI|nr:hypothetical protein N656DRAFT_175664 [Canariomyces arenarius]